MTSTDDQWVLTHLDQWAGLSHKQAMGPRPRIGVVPSWVPEDDRRRLAAYTVLDAYAHNTSRVLLADATSGEKSERREYGDPNVLIRRVTGAVLGSSTTITVDGAETTPDFAPVLSEPPTEPDEDDPISARIYATQTHLWEQAANQAVAEWEAAWADYPTLAAQQAALRAWATDAQFAARVLEWNRQAVALGDSVIELAISTRQNRPVLSVHDPGFYFPVLADVNDTYPSTVHLAWEYLDDQQRTWVRRRTYRLTQLAEPRTYPWSDEPSTVTCLMSDGRWELSAVGPNGLFDLSEDRAIWATNEDGVEARDVDLGIDFIPVVHLPNTPADQTHWGEALITCVAQLLDDIQEGDSDVRLARGLAAVPLIAASGNGVQLADDLRVEPGATISLGEGGRLDVLSMAQALPELRATVEDLLDRLSVNSGVSADVVGRVDSSAATSGVAMQLSFGPFVQLIGELRLTRQFKHSLLLKFAGRMLQLCGQIERGPIAPAQIQLGSFLPSDLAGVVDQVVSLLTAHAISRQTGVDLLVAAGMTVDDAAGEVDRIRHEDTSGAAEAAEATTSSQIGADFLGVDLPPSPAPAAVTLPEPPTQ